MPSNDRVRCAGSIDLVSRRGFVRAGALAFGGLTMADVLRLQAATTSAGNAAPSRSS